jgi:uncharacterized protein
MLTAQPARLLRIHISEGDRSGDQPLYEALLRRCRELDIAGATVFRGLEGYGETATIHRKHMITRDQPIVVVIIDSDENIARALPALEEMVDTGMIAASTVTMKRVQKDAGQTTGPVP